MQNLKTKIKKFLTTYYLLLTTNFVRGFTLIEVMVAVSIFTIAVTIGTAAVLNTNAIYRKASATRALLDNLGFVMEDMSRNLRLGNTYNCGFIGDDKLVSSPKDCVDKVSGDWAIAFEGVNGVSEDPNDQIIYVIGDPLGELGGKNSIYKTTYGDLKNQKYQRIVSPEIDIDKNKSSFVVTGAEGVGQPMVKIRLSGKVLIKKQETTFNLETVVSQRMLK